MSQAPAAPIPMSRSPHFYSHSPHTLFLALTLVVLLGAVFATASRARTDAASAEAPTDTAGGPAVPAPELLITGGEFTMGREDGKDNQQREVRVGSFYLDTYEVTNARYLEFCEATGRATPEFWSQGYRSGPDFPDHPVIGVSWRDATDFAEWAGKRLPTEAEWEYAARGGRYDLAYAGCDSIDPSRANYVKSELAGPVAVGQYAANGYGLYDMTGNVAEWVSDRYGAEYYSTGPRENPPGPETGRFRVIRGGGWHTGPGCAKLTFRNGLPSNWVDFAVGFRCARDAGP